MTNNTHTPIPIPAGTKLIEVGEVVQTWLEVNDPDLAAYFSKWGITAHNGILTHIRFYGYYIKA